MGRRRDNGETYTEGSSLHPGKSPVVAYCESMRSALAESLVGMLSSFGKTPTPW